MRGVMLASLVLLLGLQSPAVAQIPFWNIQKGYYSGITQPLQIVIRDQDQWVALWRSHSSIRAGPSPAPSVDFSVEMVVGVFLGQKSTGGYEVEITRAEEAGTQLRLYYRESSPSPDAIVTQALSQPYHLVRIPKSQASPIFIPEPP